LRKILRVLAAILAVWFVLQVPVVHATEQAAADITGDVRFSGTGFESLNFLHNGKTTDYKTASNGASITLQCDQPMAGLYLIFDLECGPYSVSVPETGAVYTAGANRFLHEYIDLEANLGNVKTVLLTLPKGARLSEIQVFSSGKLPDSVQTWSAPLDGGADLVLFSTHSDDDHLFFAGLLPTYGQERGYHVQVVYMTDHRNDTNVRVHEMLNGLWNVGIRAYPVFGDFADIWGESTKEVYDLYKRQYGTTREEILEFVVTQVRRFRPLVAVGHDLAGEYGHGMHQIYAELLTEAVTLAKDETAFPESAQAYGTWQIPKLYLHLYGEDPTCLDYDVPLESFGGMTAFEVSQKLGFSCHKSQHWTWFYGWLYGKNEKITKATQIKTYNPCYFGLYHSIVGPDVEKNDLFENIATFLQQEEEKRLEQERLEQERLEKERLEQERLEQERLEKERLEQERLEQERLEKERLEQERLRKERQEKITLTVLIILVVILLVVALVVLAILRERIQRKKRRAKRKMPRF